MLSIINAAEVQFRHDVEIRDRELALLASIRERRAASTLLTSAATPALTPALTPPVAAAPRTPVRAARAAWPRPIGIKDCTSTAACAIA